MLTRCPHCQTQFRVTAEQLKICHGTVRCGVCQDVFDALDSLSDEAPVLQGAPAVPPAVESESRRSPDGTVESIPAAAEEWAPVPAVPAPARRWPWAIGSVVLLLVAGAQLAYIFRAELAVVAPELRPALRAGCELIGCTLPRPVKPELVGIETSDLAPEGNGLLLTATLKNRAPFEQDFPHLELTLTDTQDAALVRKVLTPADYLPAGQDAAQGFAARGEVALRLALTADDVPAVGYRLYLFYP